MKFPEYFSTFAFYAVCLVCTIDTHGFVYPSLSRSLLMENGILILSLVYFVCRCIKMDNIRIERWKMFILGWIAYIAFHGWLVPVMEEYRTYYLCITLFSILPLAYLRCHRQLTRRSIENGLLLTAIIHLFYIGGQACGLTVSGNTCFSITGANENPTVTAVYLTGCMPLLARRILTERHPDFYVLLAVFSLIAIVILKCRTAYIGLCFEAVTGSVVYFNSKHYCYLSPYKHLIIPAFLVLTLFASVKLYNMKQDSADGRLLIWKIATRMIIDKPQGYGYGLFEKYYNLQQADHFRSTDATARERQTATFTGMAYNDYLEQGVEGGIPGLLFLVGFYFLSVKKALHRHDTQTVCASCAFAVMSLTNFIYSSIQPWWLLVCHASLLPQEASVPPILRYKSVRMTAYLFLILSLVILLRIASMIQCQSILSTYHSRIVNRQPVYDDEFRRLQTSIGTSEAYWTLRAYNHITAGRYNRADSCLSRAHLYSSSPQIFLMKHLVCLQAGKEGEAIQSIDTLYYMCPKLLRPKQILMENADRQGDKQQALGFAKEILDTPTTSNKENDLIREQAYQYIQQNQQR